MLTWTDRPGTEGADWEWVPDNGSLDLVLSDLGVTPRRDWTAAPQAPPRPRNHAPARPGGRARRAGPSHQNRAPP